MLADAPPRPAKGKATVSIRWRGWQRVLPVVLTPNQLAVACCFTASASGAGQTVALSNGRAGETWHQPLDQISGFDLVA